MFGRSPPDIGQAIRATAWDLLRELEDVIVEGRDLLRELDEAWGIPVDPEDVITVRPDRASFSEA
jgi:hypothetical protein